MRKCAACVNGFVGILQETYRTLNRRQQGSVHEESHRMGRLFMQLNEFISASAELAAEAFPCKFNTSAGCLAGLQNSKL